MDSLSAADLIALRWHKPDALDENVESECSLLKASQRSLLGRSPQTRQGGAGFRIGDRII